MCCKRLFFLYNLSEKTDEEVLRLLSTLYRLYLLLFVVSIFGILASYDDIRSLVLEIIGSVLYLILTGLFRLSYSVEENMDTTLSISTPLAELKRKTRYCAIALILTELFFILKFGYMCYTSFQYAILLNLISFLLQGATIFILVDYYYRLEDQDRTSIQFDHNGLEAPLNNSDEEGF